MKNVDIHNVNILIVTLHLYSRMNKGVSYERIQHTLLAQSVYHVIMKYKY